MVVGGYSVASLWKLDLILYMLNLSFKQKLIGAIIAVGLILIAIFQMGFAGKPVVEKTTEVKKDVAAVTTSPDKAQLVSTKPSPLDEAILLPAASIELTFDSPLQNSVDEIKHTINPPVEHLLKLSGDLKTVTISPKTTFQVGMGYTLTIKQETKFENPKVHLEKDVEFHFQTLQYSGV